MDRKAFSLLELLMVFCVIFILLGAFAVYANTVLMKARQQALRNELMNIRTSLEFYFILYNHNPESLLELKNKNLTTITTDVNITSNKLIDFHRLDKEGFPLDPFFNRYGYDNIKGRVWSQTKGYESW